MCEYVLNVNGKMCISVVCSVYPYVLFSHVFFFNHIVSRLLLSVTAARGAPLSDTDAN